MAIRTVRTIQTACRNLPPASATPRRNAWPSLVELHPGRRASSSVATTTDDAPPPLFQKLKTDIKTAMRAKDAQRLAVLRAITSATLNASKTASPIRTDAQLVALIRRAQKASRDAVAEFRTAARDDLAAKEEEQIAIMDEYVAASGVQTLGEAELRALVGDAVAQARDAGVAAKGLVGDVMKRLGASLQGKDVNRKELAQLVKDMTS